MIHLAIIGTGLIAHVNYKALMETGAVEVVGLCNRTLQKAEAFRDQYSLGCPVFTDYAHLYDAVKPDAVLICTPHDTHDEPFLFFAERGVHIMLEKPVADTAEMAFQMAEKAKTLGIKASVCHTQRYNQCYLTAHEFLQSGKAGKLISVIDNITYNYFWEGRPGWFLDPARAGGGIIMNYGVHQFDRVHYLCGGKTEKLFAHIETEQPGERVDSSYHITGVMDHGVTYQISCTGYSNPFQSYTEMRFTNGILRMNLTDSGFHDHGIFWGDNTQGFTSIPFISGENQYYYQMKALTDYFEGKTTEPPVSMDYAARMVQMVEYAKESHRLGQAVNTK